MSLYDDLPAPTTHEENEPTVTTAKPENGWTPRFLQPIIRRAPINKPKVNRSVNSVASKTTSTVTTITPTPTPTTTTTATTASTSTISPHTPAVSTSTSTTKPPLFKPLAIVSKSQHSVITEPSAATSSGIWSPQELTQKKNVHKRGGDLWEEEYEPHFPNDYEHWKVERKRQREERKFQEEERRSGRSGFRIQRSEGERLHEDNHHSRELREPSQLSNSDLSPPTPAPKPKVNLNITGEEAYLQRARLSKGPAPTHEDDSQGSGEPFAYKMLKQYGWSEGQGLGKYAQGINAPLSVERVAPGFGVIVNTATNQVPETEQPSKVVLLTNMVGPGEVDDTLEEETAEECSKFGKVERCQIFEVSKEVEVKVNPEEAVRIFVKFSEIQSARRALRDLNGRFFAGRKVTARFFDQDRFDRLDLAPTMSELRVRMGNDQGTLAGSASSSLNS